MTRRRLHKKHMEDYKRKKKLGWTNDIIHCNNDEKQFGDSSNTNTFRWDKTLEKDGMKNIKDDELVRLAQYQNVEQRTEWERERMESQGMEELEQRSRETDKFAMWKRTRISSTWARLC